ncbi:hypothetical protein H072_1278 [Dactylellina haptotyla CBS 200.50]|uniref:UBC core domain-containing protein n=1 Tax=Dactylellina haptotyla (strain CBS 200.50) TaxID=1284197 RepID=S8APG4_DACHA|nr:hypothetical protein H072_1278 [Dactylellina haptotyla CBS 200.50]
MSGHRRTSSLQYNKGSPGVRRILKEAQEIANSPSRDFTAYPLEHDLFEWHFTLRGPPAPSPYAGGFYHGRIILSPNYPMRPPMFRFLTDSGRFEVNRDICLSISGFHEETWQPSWSIRLALIALRAFMDSEPEGQVGGLECRDDTRRLLATKSCDYKCPECGGGGEEEAMKVEENASDSAKAEDEVPPELRFGYKDQMKPKKEEEGSETGNAVKTPADAPTSPLTEPQTSPPPPQVVTPPNPTPVQPTPTRQEDQQEPAMFIPFGPGQHQHQQQQQQVAGGPAGIPTPGVAGAVQGAAPRGLVNASNQDRASGYIDLAIGVLVSILIALVLRKM